MNNPTESVDVSVCMSTYNHEEFIVQALQSVLDQKCNLVFEVILSNDASTDGTNKVIEEFIKHHPAGSKVKYFNQKVNLGMNNNLIFTLEQAKGKYIALLEGDDYWTDMNKLQIQFDFMENNQDYTICTAAYESIDPKEGYIIRKHDQNVDGVTYTFDKILGFRPHYLNMFFQKQALPIVRLKSFSYSGDNVIFIMCLEKGKGYFSNQIFGFRRDHENGAWSSKSLIDRLLMSLEQFIGLYRFPEYRKAVRPYLIYYYADLIGADKKSLHYTISAFKLVRKPRELVYLLKKVAKTQFSKHNAQK